MTRFQDFRKSGHLPTLVASFLYFDFCFAIWVLNGAMAPFISEHFNLSAAQTGFMISVPILAGALMRFPLGVAAQYIGRKNAALVEMGLIMLGLLYGYTQVDTYNDVLVMGVFLGVAGASFGVALSLGSGWFPPQYKGLAMGIAGAGNSGTVLAVLLAPPLATTYGWQAVYGMAVLFMLIPIIVMVVFAKEPPDIEQQSLAEHVKCLWEKDGWTFNFIYIITFGGFIGLSSFLPTYFYTQFGVTKVEAGQLTMLAALMGSGVRVIGGWISDHWGGVNTLSAVFGVIIVTTALASLNLPLAAATVLFMICFSALGSGNGALFQLVPLRWPITTAVAGSMIGEVGALGGGIIPNAMGLSKQHTGSFTWGFLTFTLLAMAALVVLRVAQRKWTRSWVSAGGRAIVRPAAAAPAVAAAIPRPVPATPVLAASNGDLRYRTIVYPVGGNSELAEKASQHAAYLAKQTGGILTLVYVEDKSASFGTLAADSEEWRRIREEWTAEGERALDAEQQRLVKLGAPAVEKIIRHGFFAEEVVGVATEKNAELILLPSQKRSPIGSLLMGARTYSVFTKAPCPVLRIVR